jgi:hypothetical protein
VRLEGLGQLKKSNDLVGNRTRSLLTCRIVPQAATLQRAPLLHEGHRITNDIILDLISLLNNWSSEPQFNKSVSYRILATSVKWFIGYIEKPYYEIT